MRRIDYLKAFFKSGEHAALALLTLGVPFATGKPLALVIGAALYVVGWVLLPDRKGFRDKIDARANAVDQAQEAVALAELQAQQQKLFAKLTPDARKQYAALAQVAADIEGQLGSAGGGDAYPTEKLDGLMWSYLGLLATESNLTEYLSKEREEDFAGREKAGDDEVKKLKDELARTAPDSPSYESKFRLLSAKQEGGDALRRRHEQYRRASDNVAVVRAEQARIEEQLKLLRADLYATQSAGQFTQRINDTIDSLASGSRIASDIAPAMPELPNLRTQRIGYAIRDRA